MEMHEMIQPKMHLENEMIRMNQIIRMIRMIRDDPKWKSRNDSNFKLYDSIRFGTSPEWSEYDPNKKKWS